jgi:thiamine-monophosphate kinase
VKINQSNTSEKVIEPDIIDNFCSQLVVSDADLLDDCGYFSSSHAHNNYCVTTDTLIEGVHFIGNESSADIAHKAMMVNISDLASSGIKPEFYSMNLTFSEKCDSSWLQGFTDKLQQLQKQYDIKIIGGDTTKYDQVVISITMWGSYSVDLSPDSSLDLLSDLASSPQGQIPPLRRDNAKAGEFLYVAGKVGLARLGYLQASGKLDGDQYIRYYTSPHAQLELGMWLRNNNVASACMDISDGLFKSLHQLCQASNLGCKINNIPYVADLIADSTFGDDYILLFSSQQKNLQHHDHQLYQIGELTTEKQILMLAKNDQYIPIPNIGYTH